MATYTSIRSGNTSDINPLTNPWGNAVLPTVGDKVVIATTHIVTLDGTVNWGDDTSTGITINGTLKHSRAVNTKITARGDIVVGATGTYNAGTEADPMPSTVTAEIELNDSATMAANKWGFRTDETSNTWAGVRLWGATKTRMTDFAVQAGATDTIITVTDASGWKIGDKLVIESTVAQASISGIVYRAITGIAGNVVTLGSSVVAIKPIGTKIMNLSSNVKVYGKTGNTYPSYFSIRHASGFTTVDAIEIGETEFYCGGTTTDVMKQGVLNLTWASSSTLTDSVKRIYRPIVHNIWSVSGATVTKVNIGTGNLLHLFGNQAYRYTIEEPVLSSENHYAMTWYNGTNTDIRDIKCIRANGIANTGYSQGPVGTSITGGYMSCIANLVAGTGVIVGMSDMTINGVTNFGNQTAYGIYNQKNIIYGPMGDFTASNSASFGNGSNAPILMDGCTFQATGSAVFALTRGSTNINNTASGFSYTRRNINNDVTLQDKYTYGGKQERDNATYSNSLSSLRLDSWYSANPNVFVSSVSVGANETRRILGKCRYNTGYGTTYPTTLTVTGLGITPIVYTMPTTGADTWFPIDISVTNPNAYPGTFTLTFSGKSAANTESASVWFSGITIPDFVTVSRHYGFQLLNQPYQIENSFITETVEATVSAYTGITIDHGTNTVTLSSNHTIQEVYDYIYYNLTLNANLSEPEYFTTTDGVTFNTTYNIVNNAVLSGSGTIITTGTYSGSGSTTLVVKDSVGVRCKITSGGGSYTIKGATIAYEADITEKTIVVSPSTNVSFVMWKLGYKPQVFTINSGLLGGTFDISMVNITENINTGLNVDPILALTTTTVDGSGYHIFFGEMELSLEQMKATVHRLMKYENYFNAVLATADDNIVEIRSDEIRVNKPLFTIEREVSLTLADRVQLNGYINISNAVTIDPLYIINPGDSDGLYVTYLTVKPGIDAQYLAGVVWNNPVRTITSGGLTLAEIEASTVLAQVSDIPSVQDIVDGVWDEPLTGATHNIPTSSGRRLRQIGQIVIWDGLAQGSGIGDNQIQLDTLSANYDGAYDPSEIAIVSGTGAGQSRLILQYVGATRMATVDRNWRVKPDATSEFILYVNSGREHVNEGLAMGGTVNTITLNANASSTDNAYVGQTIFLRSGTGEDQVASVTAYNGTTKVATIETSVGNGWHTVPDNTTAYVMIPYIGTSGGSGGGLTTDEHNHLMKLRNGGGGALINFESIEKGLAKDRAWLYGKIEAIPGLITTSETNIITAIGLVNTSISTIIDSNDIENLSEKIDTLSEKTAESINIAKDIATEGKRKTEKLSHTIETYRLEDDINKETKDLEVKHEKKIQDEVKNLETEIQIQDEVRKLALEAQIQEEIKTLESNL